MLDDLVDVAANAAKLAQQLGQQFLFDRGTADGAGFWRGENALPDIGAQSKAGKLCRLLQLGPFFLAHPKGNNVASGAVLAPASFPR